MRLCIGPKGCAKGPCLRLGSGTQKYSQEGGDTGAVLKSPPGTDPGSLHGHQQGLLTLSFGFFVASGRGEWLNSFSQED